MEWPKRKANGRPPWQKGYYEHIIRNEREYMEISRYIDENPLKWTLDEYHQAEREGPAPPEPGGAGPSLIKSQGIYVRSLGV